MNRRANGRLAVLLVAFGIAGCGGNDEAVPPDDEAAAAATLEAFVAAVSDGDATAACGLLGAKALEDLEVASSCEEVLGEGMDLLAEQEVEIPDYEIDAVNVDGDTAQVTLRSEATENVVPLVREDGEWKLEGATSLDQIHPDSPLKSGTGAGEVGG